MIYKENVKIVKVKILLANSGGGERKNEYTHEKEGRKEGKGRRNNLEMETKSRLKIRENNKHNEREKKIN